MEKFKQLLAMEYDEMKDAEMYVKFALTYKAECPMMTETIYDISVEKMRHKEMITEAIEKHMEWLKEKHGHVPAEMLAVWEYSRAHAIHETGEIKRYQDMYTEK